MTIAGDLRSRMTPSTADTMTVVPGLGWPESPHPWSAAGLGWPGSAEPVSRGTEPGSAETSSTGADAQPDASAGGAVTPGSTGAAERSASGTVAGQSPEVPGEERDVAAPDGDSVQASDTAPVQHGDLPSDPPSSTTEAAVSRGTDGSEGPTGSAAISSLSTASAPTTPAGDAARTVEQPSPPVPSSAARVTEPDPATAAESAVSRGTGTPGNRQSTASPEITPIPSAPTGETVREALEADMTHTPTTTTAPVAPTATFRTAGDIAALGVGSDESTPLARSAEHALLVREGRRLGDPLPRPARTRVMVVANQKGGVGKTTSTVNLAAALAQHGLRVLVIDLDPQGNASTALSIDHHRGTPSTYDALVEGRPLAEVVQPSPEIDGLFVVPATIDLAGAEIELVSLVAREGRLRRAIHAHPQVFGTGEDRIDYVLIDCPPSLGLLTLNALVAGDEMLIPIQAEYYALEGLGQLLETVEMVKAHLNPTLTVSTIVLTMYDARTRLSAGVAEEVRTHFQGQVLRTAIPRSVRISEAPSYGQTVMTYDPGSPGALSYLEAAREMALRADLDTTVDEGARA